MNAVYGGSTHRNNSTARMLAAMQIPTSHAIARNNRPTSDPLRATRALSGDSPHALHDDGIDRDIVEAALAAGLDRGDFVDHIHAVGHACEYGVAEVAARVIEKVV